MENILIKLLSEGLSWRDHLSAQEQAEYLNRGMKDLWRERVMITAESLGIPKVLRQMAFSFNSIQAWAVYLDSVLDLFGIPELQGIACEPAEFVEKVASREPKNWEQVKEIAIEIAREYLKTQIESGDVYLLHPGNLTSPELSVYVPSIIEERSDQLKQAQSYLMEDGMVDMFDFLQLPITMELMIESGVAGRTTPEKAEIVLERMAELGLVSIPETMKKREKKSDIRKQYHELFQNCSKRHSDLLRGCVMSYDSDEQICKQGIELIHGTGHAHSLHALLAGIEKSSDEIVQLSLKGLGLLGNPIAIEKVSDILQSNQAPEVKIAACTTLGMLRADQHLDRIRDLLLSRNDNVSLAGASALLAIGTPDALDIFWQHIRRFGIARLSGLSKAIADTGNRNAVLFLIGLLLLDLQVFIDTGEVPFYNAFGQAKDEAQKTVLLAVIEKLRDQAVAGLGRFGGAAVPILISILQMYQEGRQLFQGMQVWDPAESEMEKLVDSRLREYFRFPRFDTIPNPIIHTVRALGVTHSERAIPFLKELGKADEEEIVFQVIESLSEIDIPAIDVLLNIETKSMKLKLQKIQQIGTIVHPKVTQWLIKQMEDKDPLIRMQAAILLAMRNDRNLSKILLKAAKDPHPGVRAGLANVIIRLGMDTYPEVMQLLSEDKDEDIRKIITKAQLAYKADQDNDFWA